MRMTLKATHSHRRKAHNRFTFRRVLERNGRFACRTINDVVARSSFLQVLVHGGLCTLFQFFHRPWRYRANKLVLVTVNSARPVWLLLPDHIIHGDSFPQVPANLPPSCVPAWHGGQDQVMRVLLNYNPIGCGHDFYDVTNPNGSLWYRAHFAARTRKRSDLLAPHGIRSRKDGIGGWFALRVPTWLHVP